MTNASNVQVGNISRTFGQRSRSLVTENQEQVKVEPLLPSLKLFDNPANMTGSEYRFFNEFLGPKAKVRGETTIKGKQINKSELAIKPILQS
jgi:hypothetical protein